MTQHYYMCSTMWTVCELARGNYEILPLASVKSRFILPFWYQLTRVVLDKGPLNGCVCVCACVSYRPVWLGVDTAWRSTVVQRSFPARSKSAMWTCRCGAAAWSAPVGRTCDRADTADRTADVTSVRAGARAWWPRTASYARPPAYAHTDDLTWTYTANKAIVDIGLN